MPSRCCACSNSNSSALADTSNAIAFYGAKLAFQLPDDDTYTLVATRVNGASGTDEGDFALYLGLAQELTVGQPLDATLSTGSHNDYYLVRPADQPLTLAYHKTDGTPAPDVDVNQLAGGSLQSVIQLSGQGLTQGQVTLPTGIDPLVISIGGDIFSLHVGQASVSYQLTLSALGASAYIAAPPLTEY